MCRGRYRNLVVRLAILRWGCALIVGQYATALPSEAISVVGPLGRSRTKKPRQSAVFGSFLDCCGQPWMSKWCQERTQSTWLKPLVNAGCATFDFSCYSQSYSQFRRQTSAILDFSGLSSSDPKRLRLATFGYEDVANYNQLSSIIKLTSDNRFVDA